MMTPGTLERDRISRSRSSPSSEPRSRSRITKSGSVLAKWLIMSWRLDAPTARLPFSTKKSTILSLFAGSLSTTTMRTPDALDHRFLAGNHNYWHDRRVPDRAEADAEELIKEQGRQD